MSEAEIKTLVFDYLSATSPKIAKQFKAEQKPKALGVGTPGLKEVPRSEHFSC